jgi:exodeoxyribonuclease-5
MPERDSFTSARRRLPDLSPEQLEASAAILAWLRCSDRRVFHLAGAGGSGKTEIAVALGSEIHGTQFVAFTAKAASVLRQRSASNATTLHSLLYGPPLVQDDGELVWTRRHDRPAAQLIIVNECSTISQKLGRDLIRLIRTGIKILVIGDPFQLPPVDGAPYFSGTPDFTLTEIHRQAAGSQPLQLATRIREGLPIRAVPFDIDAVLEADVVLSALNRTRMWGTKTRRKKRGLDTDDPEPGERVISLKTDHSRRLFNGSIWTVEQRVRAGRRSPVHEMLLVDDIGERGKSARMRMAGSVRS